MAFKPLHDRVLVRRIEGDEKTQGGLIIPDSAKEKPAEGEIVACGEGARKENGELIAMAVKAGDKVLFGKWSGTEVKIDGEDLLIMKESDILGTM
jgi:chaperonin GroES